MSTKLCLLEEKQSQWQVRFSKESATVHRISLQEEVWRRSSTSWITPAVRALVSIHPLLLILPILPAQPRDEAGLCFLTLTGFLALCYQRSQQIHQFCLVRMELLPAKTIEISRILFSSQLKKPMDHYSVALNWLLKLQKSKLEGLWAAGLSKPWFPPSRAARAGWVKLGGKLFSFISSLPRQRFLHCLWTCNTFNKSHHM